MKNANENIFKPKVIIFKFSFSQPTVQNPPESLFTITWNIWQGIKYKPIAKLINQLLFQL